MPYSRRDPVICAGFCSGGYLSLREFSVRIVPGLRRSATVEHGFSPPCNFVLFGDRTNKSMVAGPDANVPIAALTLWHVGLARLAS